MSQCCHSEIIEKSHRPIKLELTRAQVIAKEVKAWVDHDKFGTD